MDHNRCFYCKRKLKDAESKARGFGPVCWGKLKKLDKEEKQKKKARQAESKRKSEIIKNQISIDQYFEEVKEIE